MNNFIIAEQFLKQNDKVQKIFLDWWKPQKFDLFFADFGEHLSTTESCIIDGFTKQKAEQTKGTIRFPLLQTCQLINFIEEKTKRYLEIVHYGKFGYSLVLNDNEYVFKHFDNLGDNLLQALWQVACKIAEEE